MPIDTLEPIPGDPDVVAAAARHLQAVATEVEATSARLRALATRHDFWSGRAAIHAHARSITLPPKLAKVHDSYATAGEALRRYATVLSETQAASAAARRAASRADDDLRYARAAYNAAATRDADATRAAAGSGVPAPAPTAVRYKSDIADAEAQLQRAAAANAAAHDQQHRAAHAAAAALKQASREGLRNKPWWRRALSASAHWAAQAWTDSLRHVAKAALTISAMAGFAAIAVTLAGAVFPPLEAAAGILESISIASGAVALMSQAMLAATSNASWKTVAVDGLVVLPGLGSNASRLISRRLPILPLERINASTADVGTRHQQYVPKSREAGPHLPAPDSWADLSTLKRHFLRHGADFESESDVNYAQRAARFFLESQQHHLPTKIDLNGTIRIYEPSSNTFGSYNPLGKTRTFFKPKSSTYWQRQAGTTLEDLMRQ